MKFAFGFVAGSAGQPGNKRIPSETRALLTLPFDPDVILVLNTFVDLQDARHDADYDTSKLWNRVDVVAHVGDAKFTFASWARVRKTSNAAVFAAALLLQRQWTR